MNKSLLAASLVAINVLGFAGPVGASSTPLILLEDGDAIICTEDPEDFVDLSDGGGSFLGVLPPKISAVTGSPQEFTFTISLEAGGTVGGGVNPSNIEYNLLFLNIACTQRDFDNDGLEEDGQLGFTQAEINDDCLVITKEENGLTGDLTNFMIPVEADIPDGLLDLRLMLDFGVALQQGPATMLITIDTADCLGRSSGGSDIGSGLFSDFRLPEVAEELPDTGPSNVAPLVAFATLMIFAGAGMITRSRRIGRN